MLILFILISKKSICDTNGTCEALLESLFNLLNKRMNCNFEFKQFDGYFLLSRIFTSMTLTNKKFQIDLIYYINEFYSL